MNETEVAEYILGTFAGVQTVVANGDTFFFNDPEHKFPFATIVTSNAYDDGSDLDRPGVFRLNIGVSTQTFRSLFGPDEAAGGHDFAALDRIMPHPTYGRMHWICVLNPGPATFAAAVRPLLAEAYEQDLAKHARKAARG